jgi:hypothetical protein
MTKGSRMRLAAALSCFLFVPAAWAQEAPTVPAASSPCCKLGDAGCSPNEYSGLRVALVVGVDDYGEPGPAQDKLINLKNAKNDARELARILADSYAVRCILDPDAEAFKGELKKLRDYLNPLQADSAKDLDDNSVIVHFSGHGFREAASDFILLSGRYPSKAEAMKAAVPIFQVSDALESLTRFAIYLVFDSCRNRSDANFAKPDWSQGFGKPEPYSKHGHTIVFGAAQDTFAFDRNETIGAKENGALVFTLSKYFNFPAMTLREVYEIPKNDPSLIAIGQIPALEPGRVYSRDPWTTRQQICSAPETLVALQVIECRLSGGTNCIDTHVCKKELRKFDQFIQDNGGPSASCSRKKLFDTFGELGKKCDGGVAGPVVAQGLGGVSPGAAALNQLHLNAILSESELQLADNRKLKELFATADQPARPSRPSKAAERGFLAAQRSILNVSNPFSDEATAKLRVKDERVELKLRPSANAGTTGRLQPTGRPKVDCDAHPCTLDWVFVRVPTAAGTVDGWLPASKVEIAQPSKTLVVDFPGDEFVATPESRKKVRELSDSVREFAAAEITTIVPAQAANQARALAAARLASAKNMLTGLLKSQQISTRILSADDVPANGQVTVQLYKP